jgi:hypothetical protein
MRALASFPGPTHICFRKRRIVRRKIPRTTNNNNPLAAKPETENDAVRSGCSTNLFLKFTSEAAALAPTKRIYSNDQSVDTWGRVQGIGCNRDFRSRSTGFGAGSDRSPA